MKYTLLLAIAFLLKFNIAAQFSTIDIQKAKQYFNEAKRIADKDNKQLWNACLYGPMIFINPQTKDAIANEPDSSHVLKQVDGIYIGIMPDSFRVANTAQYWSGKVWTIIQWPLPIDTFERAALMMHESYHRLQKLNKLPSKDANCTHLDTYDGRVLLKLELEALRKVINDYPFFSGKDLQNALTIRSYRYQKFPEADSLENCLELNEGIAEFTGQILAGRNLEQMKKKLSNTIDEFYEKATFVRSVAYVTGPLYGFLLSNKNKSWNKVIYQNATNCAISFKHLIIQHYKLNTPKDLQKQYQLIINAGLYNYATISAFENNREDKRLKILSYNKGKFIDGPVLELPNVNMKFVFNPNEVQMIDGYGPVYPTFNCTASWGSLEVTSGGVLIKDWMYVRLALPEKFNPYGQIIKTDSWQLKLSEGWIIQKGKRKGDFIVVKER